MNFLAFVMCHHSWQQNGTIIFSSLSHSVFPGSSSNINLLTASFIMNLYSEVIMLLNGFFVTGAGNSKLPQNCFSSAWQMDKVASTDLTFISCAMVSDFVKLAALLVLNEVNFIYKFHYITLIFEIVAILFWVFV